jgi:ABC-type glycerol-3-phosphate transport system substrate-binding protein
MSRKLYLTLLLAGLALFSMAVPSLMAQSDETIITIAVEEWRADAFTDEIFAEFEAANPGVKVVPVILSQDDLFFGRPNLNEEGSVQDYIEGTYQYTSRADVIPVSNYQLDHYATRTGAYLDIAPLLQADSDANPDDFYPVMLESFQWDGGTWALPVSGNLSIVIYDKLAFDEAGLSYPTTSWTVADYTNTALELAERNEEGNIVQPGIFTFSLSNIIRAQLGENLVDDNSFPEMPDFSNPELVTLLQTWRDYQQTVQEQSADGISNSGSPAEIPLNVTGFFLLEGFMTSEQEREWEAAFLPNDRALVNASGYAVSAGTDNPQLAYELVQFMTTSPEIVWRSFGDVNARRSMQGMEQPENSNIGRRDRPERVLQLIDEAIEKAIPVSQVAFFGGLNSIVMDSSENDAANIETQLQEAEQRIRNTLNAVAEASQNQTQVASVATPVPTPVLADDEISLSFVYNGLFGSFERATWEEKAREFVAQDAEVGNIEIASSPGGDLNETFAQNDCAFFGQNLVRFADTSLMLPLDPFLAADPDFNADDLPGRTLDEVRVDNRTYGLPLFIQPLVMWYQSDIFEEAGIPVPENNWDISAFEDTLRQLADYTASDDPPYESWSFNTGTNIQMLAAAYGAENLIDYSTEPATFNLTTDTNIEAIRQVLNLAKEGYIDYEPLAIMGGGGGFGRSDVPLYDALFRPGDSRLSNRGNGNSQRIVMFPRGSSAIPVSYNLSVGLISAQSDAPEACYRWLTWLSQQPEIPGGIPVNRMMMQNNSYAASIGEDVAAFYRDFANLLEEPNVVDFGSPFGTGSGGNFSVTYTNYVSRLWMNRAFDRYVLDDAVLDDELQASQQYIEEFKTCSATIAVPDNAINLEPEESQRMFGQFRECAVSVDPEMEEIMPAPQGGDNSDE